ncbi:hypothetical protein AX15_001034 [Amanita polypyramis BW_CC]|nr:hypothetical protein AX15_001034 [Amanita polypyramis BW_CC]
MYYAEGILARGPVSSGDFEGVDPRCSSIKGKMGKNTVPVVTIPGRTASNSRFRSRRGPKAVTTLTSTTKPVAPSAIPDRAGSKLLSSSDHVENDIPSCPSTSSQVAGTPELIQGICVSRTGRQTVQDKRKNQNHTTRGTKHDVVIVKPRAELDGNFRPGITLEGRVLLDAIRSKVERQKGSERAFRTSEIGVGEVELLNQPITTAMKLTSVPTRHCANGQILSAGDIEKYLRKHPMWKNVKLLGKQPWTKAKRNQN